MKEALAEVGNFKIGGRVRFSDDMTIIAKIQKSYKIW